MRAPRAARFLPAGLAMLWLGCGPAKEEPSATLGHHGVKMAVFSPGEGEDWAAWKKAASSGGTDFARTLRLGPASFPVPSGAEFKTACRDWPPSRVRLTLKGIGEHETPESGLLCLLIEESGPALLALLQPVLLEPSFLAQTAATFPGRRESVAGAAWPAGIQRTFEWATVSRGGGATKVFSDFFFLSTPEGAAGVIATYAESQSAGVRAALTASLRAARPKAAGGEAAPLAPASTVR